MEIKALSMFIWQLIGLWVPLTEETAIRSSLNLTYPNPTTLSRLKLVAEAGEQIPPSTWDPPRRFGEQASSNPPLLCFGWFPWHPSVPVWVRKLVCLPCHSGASHQGNNSLLRVPPENAAELVASKQTHS